MSILNFKVSMTLAAKQNKSSLYNTVNNMTTHAAEKNGSFSDKDGHFRRKESQFRKSVSADPAAEFPAEKGRYVLYLNLGCPWFVESNYYDLVIFDIVDKALGRTVLISCTS